MNNIEDDIKLAFENHDIKLRAIDIINKAQKKKKAHFFDFLKKPIYKYGLTGACVCTAALMVAFIPNYKSREAMIRDELFNRNFYNSLIGATNKLASDKDINKDLASEEEEILPIASLEEQRALEDAFDDVQGVSFIEFNKHQNSARYDKTDRIINGTKYEYVATLNENVYSSNYNFYFSIDAKNLSLDGIILTEGSIIEGIAFSSILVDGTFSIDYKATYFDLTFTPQIFNQDIIGKFNIKEEKNGSTSYTYTYKENEISSFNILSSNNKIKIDYENEDTHDDHIKFDFLKNNEYSYSCNYLYKKAKGSFDIDFKKDTYEYVLRF